MGWDDLLHVIRIYEHSILVISDQIISTIRYHLKFEPQPVQSGCAAMWLERAAAHAVPASKNGKHVVITCCRPDCRLKLAGGRKIRATERLPAAAAAATA